MSYQPPFDITAKIINQISAIAEQVGRLNSHGLSASPQLRKRNRIRTIQGTLAIEGNTLSLEQVTAILEGKRVLGQPREISEVKGAIRTYEALAEWKTASIEDFLTAHQYLMGDILTDAGKFRRAGVGIHKESKVVHVAPPAKRVPLLMSDLLDWLDQSEDHALIKSCVFHYELEFIHPCMDGNGRMGRLWQTLILGQWNPIFFLLPIESVIKDEQERYYQTLEKADQAANSTVFIEFMLEIIGNALAQINQGIDQATDQATDQAADQVKRLLAVMDDSYVTTQILMERLGLSHRPTFRKNYLIPALDAGLLEMKYPDKPRSPKQQYRKQ
ncbi:Fic family protein [Leptothoe spongobia]|uniref:Fic family protein n=1 Tax=Leptothoe spongobia TAU-MAC 1115 TaxID=1967444 RepID=A0A947DFJ7_9CYAN|nr:Fic family protein [Leptothoe spongobia]MBT9315840.1 Fic family protein [Leptothoe spongobia TAU-MAC 1115]